MIDMNEKEFVNHLNLREDGVDEETKEKMISYLQETIKEIENGNFFLRGIHSTGESEGLRDGERNFRQSITIYLGKN